MISPRLTSIFRTATGSKFRGLLTAPEDRFDGDNIRARRILRVDQKTPLVTGDVVRLAAAEYLLFEHSEAPEEVRFLAFQITHKLRWTRFGEVIDPVSLMAREDAEVELDPSLAAVVEPVGITEVQGMERNKYEIRAPGVFQPGDILGPYTVNTVQVISGASILGAY